MGTSLSGMSVFEKTLFRARLFSTKNKNKKQNFVHSWRCDTHHVSRSQQASNVNSLLEKRVERFKILKLFYVQYFCYFN